MQLSVAPSISQSELANRELRSLLPSPTLTLEDVDDYGAVNDNVALRRSHSGYGGYGQSAYGNSRHGHSGYGGHSGGGYGGKKKIECCELVVDPLAFLSLLGGIFGGTAFLNVAITMNIRRRRRRSERVFYPTPRIFSSDVLKGRL